MPLSAAQIQQLSRLLDEALALPEPAREAWLLALPEAVQPLVQHLRLALQAHAAGGPSPLTLPVLGGAAEGEGAAGEIVGAHRLLREIGRGGMGSVWLAERADGIFQRRVAIKLPRLDRHPGLAARMAREREIGARLEHRHIARLYDAGIDARGRPYLVMEHVDGEPIDQHARLAKLDRDDTLRLLLQVCAAVAHAHRHLVVHRDLKPANILVDLAGQVKLLDFGVARWLDDSDGARGGTHSDVRHTFTPRYAAPEQRGSGAISTATDLYALGLVAHELLAGHLPASPGLVDAAALGPELAAVLHRALREDPAERQGSVDVLSQDLKAVLARHAPPSVRVPRWRLAWLFVRRHAAAVGIGAASALALAGAGAALAVQRHEALQQQVRLNKARLFLMTTIADAEAPAGVEPGVPAMIATATARARTDLASQPVLQADVMAQIAVLQARFGDGTGALALLSDAHALMERHAAASDPARQQVAGLLAIRWVDSGDPTLLERAGALAGSVLSACREPRPADAARCAKARAWAQAALRNRAAWRGDAAGAAEAARQVVVEAVAAFGDGHPEVSNERMHLASTLRNLQRFADAAAELAVAASAAERQPLKAADARKLRQLQALLANDNGHHAQALHLLAEPAMQADPLAMRVRASAALALGQLALSLEAAEAAAAAAERAGTRWDLAVAWQQRARALAGLGRTADAEAALAEARRLGRALGFDDTSQSSQRLRRVAGEVALRAGRAHDAELLLAPLAQGGLPTVELAAALDQLGAALRMQGRAPEALAQHARAGQLLASVLRAGHPLRLRNRLDAALARQLAGQGAGTETAAAAAAYLDTLPADSAWRGTIRRLVDEPAAGLKLSL